MTKKHVWRIKKEYFHQLKNGEKTLEIRVGYPQIKKVQAGDTITFENYGPNLFKVLDRRQYTSFEQLLDEEGLNRILPDMTRSGALRTLRKIYPADKEALGIYAFELRASEENSKERILKASDLLKDGRNREFAELIYLCYCATDWICKDYPDHCDHFFTKYVPGVFDGTREILGLYCGQELAGMIVLKKAIEAENSNDPAAARPVWERKISTLYVKPEYQNRGIASKLIEASFKWLGTTKPLLSIADYKIPQFEKMIKKYDWKKTQELEKYYNDSATEYVYNGRI